MLILFMIGILSWMCVWKDGGEVVELLYQVEYVKNQLSIIYLGKKNGEYFRNR